MVKEIKINYEIKPGKLQLPSISIFQYQESLSQTVIKGNITRKECLELLELMLTIRTFEEMLVEILAGIYRLLPRFTYVGPTHLSIGQEATAAGSISRITNILSGLVFEGPSNGLDTNLKTGLKNGVRTRSELLIIKKW